MSLVPLMRGTKLLSMLPMPYAMLLPQSIAGGSVGRGFRLAPRRKYRSLAAAWGLPEGSPRFTAFWVEVGATITHSVEVLSTVPPWEGYDNDDALKFAWVAWSLDTFWLGATVGIRLYRWCRTTGTHVADFMKHPTLGYFDLGRAAVKWFINIPIIRFEFFTGDFHVLKLLHAYLRLFDGGVGVIAALAYLIAGVAAKTKKDVALMATGVNVAAELIKC